MYSKKEHKAIIEYKKHLPHSMLPMTNRLPKYALLPSQGGKEEKKRRIYKKRYTPPTKNSQIRHNHNLII